MQRYGDRAGGPPRSQDETGEEIDQRQQRQHEIGRRTELRQHHEFRRGAPEHRQRQQMVGEIFAAGAQAFDNFEQQQDDAERKQRCRRASPAKRTPDIKVNVKTGSVEETPGIRKTMMLQIARGIRSSGKPITDIGKASFIQAGGVENSRADESSVPGCSLHSGPSLCSGPQA